MSQAPATHASSKCMRDILGAGLNSSMTLLTCYAGPRKPGEGIQDEEQGIVSAEATPSGCDLFLHHNAGP